MKIAGPDASLFVLSAAVLTAPLTMACITPCDSGWTSTSRKRIQEDQWIARKFPHETVLGCHRPTIGIVTRGSARCIGTLLDARTVLTAAHYVGPTRDDEAFYPVETRTRDALGARCIHPDYSRTCPGDHDLAVVRLEEPVKTTEGAIAAVSFVSVRDAGAAQGAFPSSIAKGDSDVFGDDSNFGIYMIRRDFVLS